MDYYLIICREAKHYTKLDEILSRTDLIGKEIIVASDDIELLGLMKNNPKIKNVDWIEKMDSFYSVAPDVIKYIDEINRYLERTGSSQSLIPKDLFFWICHVEGGMTAQRVQDALLLIKSYLDLIDKYKIRTLFIICSSNAIWEDEVFLHVAKAKGVYVESIGKYNISIIKRKTFSLVKAIIKEAFYVLNILWRKVYNRRKYKCKIHTNEIDFQICGRAKYHIENVLPIMKDLNKKGYNSVALSWNILNNSRNFSKDGIIVEELEKYISIKCLLRIPFYLVWYFIKYNKLKKQFINNNGLIYENITLAEVLWASIKYFLVEELPQRCRLNDALKNYFKVHSPCAIKLWGGDKLIEGNLVIKNVTRGVDIKPLFMYWFWMVFDYPYESDYKCIDLLLIPGNIQKNHLIKKGVLSDNIVSIGVSRHDHLVEFQKNYNPNDSRSLLSISKDFSLYIFLDINVVLRGFLSYRELTEVYDALLNYIIKNKSVALIVKPHPSCSKNIIDYLKKNINIPNFYLFEKEELPYHAINASDIVITKYSTIGIEAMFLYKAIISVSIDGEKRFRLFEDGAEYVDNTEKMIELLSQINNDKNFKQKWTLNQSIRQKEFLKEYFDEIEKPSEVLAAEAIDKFIKIRYKITA